MLFVLFFYFLSFEICCLFFYIVLDVPVEMFALFRIYFFVMCVTGINV